MPRINPAVLPSTFVANRNELMTLCDLSDGVGVEIGVCRGHFSDIILKHTKLKRLYSIDPWSRPESEPLDDAHTSTVNMYLDTLRLLSKHGERSVVYRARSEEAIAMFDDASLDFVYIDGDHRYEAVQLDISLWWPKLKPGGIFAGHDYSGNCHGVMRAVDEFFRANELKLYMTEIDEVNLWTVRSWFTIKPEPVAPAA